MKTASMLRKTFTLAIAGTFIAASVQAPVMAAMVDNQQLALHSQLQTQRNEVRTFLAREDVRSAMLAYGIADADIDARIDNLTEAELLQIQDRIGQLPAGGNGLLEAIVVVILVFVLLDALGVTDVFPRV